MGKDQEKPYVIAIMQILLCRDERKHKTCFCAAHFLFCAPHHVVFLVSLSWNLKTQICLANTAVFTEPNKTEAGQQT